MNVTLPAWMAANLGEFSAWLVEDAKAAQSFADWRNLLIERMDVEKPAIDGHDVQQMAGLMFKTSARAITGALS